MRTPRSIVLAALALLAAVGPARAQSPSTPRTEAEKKSSVPPIPPGLPTTASNAHWPTEAEVKLGREVAAMVEKEYAVITSGPYYERLQRVGQEVVRAVMDPAIVEEYRRKNRLPRPGDTSRRVPFEFTFKVVDSTKEINAFALAGGPIYATRGLLDWATSDDELAGVLAHECIHVMYHHVDILMKKQKKISTAQLYTLLAAVVAGAAGGGSAVAAAGQVMLGGQLVGIATMSGYGRELEAEADRVGAQVLSRTRYNPAGMLTMMQKIAYKDRLHGNPDYGIFQDHPYSNERVAAIRKTVEELGYRVDSGVLRQVSGSFRVQAVPLRWKGKEVVELRMNDGVLFTVVAGEEGMPPVRRAERIAELVETLFGENATLNDVKLNPEKTTVLVKGVPVIRVQPEDAEVLGSAPAVADRALRALHRALWKEKLEMQH